MILATIILFSLTALIGLYLVVLGVRYRRKSLTIGLTHASAGLIAFGLLITQIIGSTINKYYNVAALLIVLALIGGLMLFALREANKPPPMILVSIHAVMALAGLLLLYLGFFST